MARAEPRLLLAGGGRRLAAWRVWAPRPARLEASAAGAADLSPDGSRDGSTDSLPDLLVLAGDEVYVWQSRATPQRQYLAV